MINGVILTPLKRITHPKGDVFRAMKRSDAGFTEFGEAYFSTVIKGDIKGWKKHSRMVLNLVVPVGAIKFVIHDDRQQSNTRGEFYTVVLSPANYCRLTVPPGVYFGFQGLDEGLNLLLNLANIEHDPEEASSLALHEIEYSWASV